MRKRTWDYRGQLGEKQEIYWLKNTTILGLVSYWFKIFDQWEKRQVDSGIIR